MAKKDFNLVKIVTGVGRLSFAHLKERHAFDEGKAKYQATIIIPKEDGLTLEKFEDAYEELYDLERKDTFRNVPLTHRDVWKPFRDGDDYLLENPEREDYADSMFFTAKSASQPKCFDSDGSEIWDYDEVYSGCYVRAVVKMYAYNNKGKKGFGLLLDSIKKIDDGERFGGSTASADDYEDEDDRPRRKTAKPARRASGGVDFKKTRRGYTPPYEDDDLI